MKSMLLVRPAPEYAEAIADFRRECLDAGSRMDGCGPLRRMEDPMDWVRYCQAWDTDGPLPEGVDWVRSTQFLYIRPEDGKMVGTIQVRHRFNAFLAAYGGAYRLLGPSLRAEERLRRPDAAGHPAVVPADRPGKGSDQLPDRQCGQPKDHSGQRRSL